MQTHSKHMFPTCSERKHISKQAYKVKATIHALLSVKHIYYYYINKVLNVYSLAIERKFQRTKVCLFGIYMEVS